MARVNDLQEKIEQLTDLVLLDGCDLRVDRRYARARVRRRANGTRIALERAVDERVDHPLDVTCGLRVRERLVRCCLLQAVRVLFISKREEKLGQHAANTHLARDVTVIFPAPLMAAAAPNKPKTESTIPSGLFACKLCATEVRNCS